MLINPYDSERYSHHEALELFIRLLEVPSPPGREERLAQIVGSLLEEMGYAFERDGAGNLTVRLDGGASSTGSSAGKLLFSAHMDEIGMVVTAIEPDGVLKVNRSGGLYPAKIGEGPVDIVGDGEILSGVLCMGSMHRPDAATHQFTWNDVYVVTGLQRQKLEALGVRVGSSIVPARFRCGPYLFGEADDPLVAAWTFDDRMGVVTLLRLLASIKKEGIMPARPTLVCFTVCEEGGCQGAAVVAQRERPEVFVAIDGCPIPPGVEMKLDGRPGIWSKDRSTNFDQALIGDFSRAAREAGTELQVAVYSAAYSDSSKAYEVGAAERVATLGQVRENSHGYEVARLSVFDNLLKTLVQFLKTWK
jgi:putative aminopeptidase FrvX